MITFYDVAGHASTYHTQATFLDCVSALFVPFIVPMTSDEALKDNLVFFICIVNTKKDICADRKYPCLSRPSASSYP